MLDQREKNVLNSFIEETRDKLKDLSDRLQRAEADLRELRNR